MATGSSTLGLLLLLILTPSQVLSEDTADRGSALLNNELSNSPNSSLTGDTSTFVKTLLLALVVIAISFTASINKWLAGPISDIVPPPGDGSPAFPHYLRNSTRL